MSEKPITMLQSVTGSPDGITVHLYVAGESYPQEGKPMSADLADVFLREGLAAPAEELGGGAAPSETTADAPTDTGALCGVMTAQGKPCRMRLPCRFHEG